MGRSTPTDENNVLIHPSLSLLLFAAAMAAASFAMITSLCSMRRKRQRNADHEDDPHSDMNVPKWKEEAVVDVNTTTKSSAIAMSNETSDDDVEASKDKGLPVPPGKKTSGIGEQGNTWNASNVDTKRLPPMKKSASDRRLLSSLSLKLPRSLSMARKGEKSTSNGDESVHHNKRKNRKMSMSAVNKHEESIWMKTIILGEKNRVPEGDEDAMIIDTKGRKIPAYHPRSRQNSFVDERTLPSQIRSGQCSFVESSKIPEQSSSNAKTGGDQREISEGEQ